MNQQGYFNQRYTETLLTELEVLLGRRGPSNGSLQALTADMIQKNVGNPRSSASIIATTAAIEDNVSAALKKAEQVIYAAVNASRLAAEAAATASETAKTNAEAAQALAETAASASQTSATNAAASENAASGSATAASDSASLAAAHATDAGTQAAAAQTAKVAAETAKAAAEVAQASAATSETNAASSAATASQQATLAANSANAAGQSASAASDSATVATTKATEASQSASAATSAKNTAETAAGQASASAASAAVSEQDASQHVAQAQQSAQAAAASETAAGNSATAAATSQQNAATSATNAAGSASQAAQSQTLSADAQWFAFTERAKTNNVQYTMTAEADEFLAGFTSVDLRAASSIDADGALSWVVNVDGPAIRQNAAIGNNRYISERVRRPVVSGQNWTIRFGKRVIVDRASGGLVRSRLFLVGSRADDSYVGLRLLDDWLADWWDPMTVASGRIFREVEFDPAAEVAAAGWTDVTQWRITIVPALLVDGETVDISAVNIRNVSEVIEAAGHASASASSATAAASSADAAGQSATAATQSKLAAETAAGNALLSETSAASSATTAAGHAATVATNTTLAARAQKAAASTGGGNLAPNGTIADPDLWISHYGAAHINNPNAIWVADVDGIGTPGFYKVGNTSPCWLYGSPDYPVLIDPNRTYRISAEFLREGAVGTCWFTRRRVTNAANYSYTAGADINSIPVGQWESRSVTQLGSVLLNVTADPSSPGVVLFGVSLDHGSATGNGVKVKNFRVEDITESTAAESAAEVSTTKAAEATGAAAQAVAAQSVTARLSALSVSGPGDLPLGLDHFTTVTQGDPQTIAKAVDNATYAPRLSAVASTDTAVGGKDVRATGYVPLYTIQTFPIDPSRKYRIRARVKREAYVGGSANLYVGLNCLNNSYSAITAGTKYTAAYALNSTSFPVGGFVEFLSLIITGEGAGGYQFAPGTVSIRLNALLNHPGTDTGNVMRLSLLELIDVTDEEALVDLEAGVNFLQSAVVGPAGASATAALQVSSGPVEGSITLGAEYQSGGTGSVTLVLDSDNLLFTGSTAVFNGDLFVNGSITPEKFESGAIKAPLGYIDVEAIETSDPAFQFKHPGMAIIYVIGAGGAGGRASNDSNDRAAAAGGGAGGFASLFIRDVDQTATYAITVGAGGASPTSSISNESADPGDDGSATSFVGPGINVVANGGKGGGAVIHDFNDTITAVGGAGGTASGGDYNYTGGRGGDARCTTDGLAAGGGGCINFGCVTGTVDAPTMTNRLAASADRTEPMIQVLREMQDGAMPFMYYGDYNWTGTAARDSNRFCSGGGGGAEFDGATGGPSNAGGDGIVFVFYLGERGLV